MADPSQRRYASPLRYPGGKGKTANFFKLLLLHNGLVGFNYAEPYAGGASVALTLLYEEYASHVHLNDINRSLFAFWDATLHHTEELCRRIKDTPVTIDIWKEQRAVQAATDPNPIDLAFSTFFLNRTNRSGIIGGGVIGGKEQDGDWKLDARFNKGALIQRIQKVARYRNRITLTRCDAADYLQKVLPELPRETFIYLDPPYYVKGEGLYEHSYQHEDHVVIASLVSKVQQPWVVSYDAAQSIKDLYKGHKQFAYGLNYSAADRYEGAEIMFFSPTLMIPNVESPAKVSTSMVCKMRAEMLHVSSLF